MGYKCRLMLVLLACCSPCCFGTVRQDKNLQVVNEWATFDLVFPDEKTRQAAIDSGEFVPLSCVATDVETYYKKGSEEPRVFVAIPRCKPTSFGTVQADGRIAAYPDYSWHENNTNCDGITSVFRVAVDRCNRLWMVDTGKDRNVQICPAKLIAFDLETDKLVYSYEIPESSNPTTSLIVTPTVDVREDCTAPFVYAADVNGYGLTVFDVANDRSWRLDHRLFYPYPDKGVITVDGLSFDTMDGIIGLALSNYVKGQERYMYFHALASTTENIVATSLLRNDSFIEDSELPSDGIKILPGERKTQAVTEAIDENGILYFGQNDPPSIYCWNTATEYGQQNFYPVAVNQETLQYAMGVKVVNNHEGIQELWVLTARYQRYQSGNLDDSTLNYRVLTGKLPDLLKNNPCLIKRKTRKQRREPEVDEPIVLVKLNTSAIMRFAV